MFVIKTWVLKSRFIFHKNVFLLFAVFISNQWVEIILLAYFIWLLKFETIAYNLKRMNLLWPQSEWFSERRVNRTKMIWYSGIFLKISITDLNFYLVWINKNSFFLIMKKFFRSILLKLNFFSYSKPKVVYLRPPWRKYRINQSDLIWLIPRHQSEWIRANPKPSFQCEPIRA